MATKKVTIEAPPGSLRELLPSSKRKLSIYGLLREWKIDPQKLKEELREEE